MRFSFKMRLSLICLLLIAPIGINAKGKQPLTEIAPCVWFEGAINAEDNPTGHGTLRVVNARKVKKATRTETITGDFDGNVVKNAEIKTLAWVYTGDLQWNILQENGMHIIEYHLINGSLQAQTINISNVNAVLPSGEIPLGELKKQMYELVRNGLVSAENQTYTIIPDDEICIKRLVGEHGTFFPEPFIMNYVEKGEDTDGLSIWGEKNCTIKGTKLYIEFVEDPFLFQFGTNGDKTKIYSNGTTVTEKNSHTIVETATGNFIDYYEGAIQRLVWNYPEAIVRYNRDSDGSILYADGNVFIGEFSLGKLYMEDNLNNLIKSINVPSLNDIDLAYRYGVETSIKGGQIKWNNNVADWQLEQMEENRMDVEQTLVTLSKEMIAEKVAEAANKLEAAKPQLVAKYGAANVNNIFNYKVEKGMPIELFRELRRMNNALIEVSQEVYDSDDYFERKTMMVVLRDRQTYEIVFQQFIHFNLGDKVYAITSKPFAPKGSGEYW